MEEVTTYDKKGKRDPFVSLVVTAVEKPKKGQTPLENYDISAIKILGIVWNEKGNFATVVLPDGKAYTLREGMTIGIHEGKIQKINKNHIVIIERIKDYKGQLKSKETILKLREGRKNETKIKNQSPRATRRGKKTETRKHKKNGRRHLVESSLRLLCHPSSVPSCWQF